MVTRPHRPLVSVVIPAYNYGEFLPETLQSILGQSYRPLEIIVVDDGSTDNTREMVAHVAPGHIRYLSQENKGQAAARNRGIREARGELIAFSDADDVWLPEKLGRQVEVFRRNPNADIVYCDVYKFSSARTFPKTLWEEKGITPCRGGRECLPQLFERNFIPGAMTVVRKRAFNQFGYYDETLRVCEEYSLWVNMLLAGAQIDYVPAPLAKYRQHPKQLTANIERIEQGNLGVFNRCCQFPEVTALVGPAAEQKRLARIYGASAKRYLLRGKALSTIGKGSWALAHLMRYCLTRSSMLSKATARP